jgi:hypothetical protein
MNRDDNDERFCLDRLAALKQAYERDAEPYIKKLSTIYARRPFPPIMLELTPDEAEVMRTRLKELGA